MKILVTGATGFLGRALSAALERAGHEVTGFGSRTCDLRERGSLARFDSLVFDRIFHLAAWTQAGDFCLTHAGEQWIVNQEINTNVLAWWQARQPSAKLICMGTSCAYAPGLPLVEENYLSGLPIESLFTYAMTKRMLLVGLLALRRQFGLRYLCLVPSTLYGPGYHADGRQMHFIFDLIRKILRGKLYGDPVVLWGDGLQARELVYIDDFVRLACQLSDMTDSELVNVGAGEEFAIRHFAKLICDEVGYDLGAIRFDPARHVGARSKCLDVTKLHRLVPDPRLTSLSEGLKKTIAWFLEEPARLASP